jgi:hypothetical protein
MSIAFDRFCLIISLTIPYAVELSVRRGVGGCVWPSSVSVTLSGAPLWALWKHAPTSDSAAKATTFLMTAATLRIYPLSVSCSGDLLPSKNKPPRRLRAWETKRLEASLWMCNTCWRRDIGLWHPGGLLSNPTFDLWRLASSPSPWFVPLQ